MEGGVGVKTSGAETWSRHWNCLSSNKRLRQTPKGSQSPLSPTLKCTTLQQKPTVMPHHKNCSVGEIFIAVSISVHLVRLTLGVWPLWLPCTCSWSLSARLTHWTGPLHHVCSLCASQSIFNEIIIMSCCDLQTVQDVCDCLEFYWSVTTWCQCIATGPKLSTVTG